MKSVTIKKANDEPESEGPLPISHPTVTKVEQPKPLPKVITCANCQGWQRLNPRAAWGQCHPSRKFGATTVITTDMQTCSMPIPFPED